MGFGEVCDPRTLPIYSVGTAEEAKELLVLTCPTNAKGEFVSPETAQEQTLEKLDEFGLRLDRGHELMKLRGRCCCE